MGENTLSDGRGAYAAWKSFHEVDKTPMTLDILARTYNVTGGKWMMTVPKTDVDQVWNAVARAVAEGKLGTSAKVSTSEFPRPTEPGCAHISVDLLRKETHVICVYTRDYHDLGDVFRVRHQLFQMGFQSELHYKPDIYTYCRLYEGNPWQISTSMYRL